MKLLQKMKQKKADNKGFSLVELIIVIAIMAILVGIVGTQVVPYLNKSKIAKDRELMNSFSTAAMTAYSSNAADIAIPAADADGKQKLIVEVYTSATGDAGTLATEIKNLTYATIPADKFTSNECKGVVDDVKVTYNFTDKTITVELLKADNTVIAIEAVESDM